MSKNACNFIDECPMFKYFTNSAKRIYLEVYCKGDYTICRRRQLRLVGEPVPDNLLPHGGTLWDNALPKS